MERLDPLLKYSWFPESESLYLSHLHEIIYSTMFYFIIHKFIAPLANRIVFGKSYTSITNDDLKDDFDIHTVSMVQAFVSLYILWPTLSIPLNTSIATYWDHQSSMVAALSCGYFLWDLTICIKNYKLYGLEFFAHAIGSLYVMLISLRPCCQPWIGKYLLYEISTPFVNVNWYIIQLTSGKDMTVKTVVPTPLNIINGLCLMAVFFVVRILWGSTANFILFRQFIKEWDQVPKYRSIGLIALNLTLTALNAVWFHKMVKIARKLASKSETTTTKKH
ncbi:similar to Saccharomyces cerevisiae YJR116W TDA4 Putative protein of unknown function [Maudiozyma barnettii]|uniref:TLC domain-containing protein n=1 Tax=Maudiozyma barnettii TaxID=61262 RepID=A0A8H2VHL5_9SACH|nr:Tda4p [Kazachstania barnettii]CAB4255616.1 similar to Saccharomyces cerevisiae YJR116W TDA4 Putative protein of unknown function [Kazachstania barnettii]CAD1784177.1 similar to Saccharomyces cerevisiae YJR116W TDA4 Putative protein of unknown function [Kazachstania barnettii]